jgi:hypothetical protein
MWKKVIVSQFYYTGICLETNVRVKAKFLHPRQEGIEAEQR